MSLVNLIHSLPFHESLSGWVIGSNPDCRSEWTQGPVQLSLSLLSQPECKSVEQVFCLVELWGRENEALPALIASSLWRLWIPGSANLWSSQPCPLSSNWISECAHLFIDKSMVKLSLLYQEHGYQAWVQNCTKILLHSCSKRLSRIRQDRASERNAQLAGESKSLQQIWKNSVLGVVG